MGRRRIVFCDVAPEDAILEVRGKAWDAELGQKRRIVLVHVPPGRPMESGYIVPLHGREQSHSLRLNQGQLTLRSAGIIDAVTANRTLVVQDDVTDVT